MHSAVKVLSEGEVAVIPLYKRGQGDLAVKILPTFFVISSDR
jgi:hypothetical protein